MIDVRIRDAEPADGPTLAAAEHEIAATPGLLVSKPGEIRDFAFAGKVAQLGARSDALYRVAELDGRIVGHILLDPMGLDAIRHVVRLNLVVHVGYQDRGVGRRLLDDAVTWARAAEGVEKIELLVRDGNDRAIGLYESFGFIEEGRLRRRVRLGPDSYLDDIAMALWVGAD